ncbi:MAG: formylmethanofuran dehydrogenase subunit B [Fimbriiglobus sp.]
MSQHGSYADLMEKTFTDVACTVCGCACDDLRITVDGQRITRAENACSLAEPWYLGQNAHMPPPCEILGEATSREVAVQRAREILHSAKSLLIYGLSRSTTEGQRHATELADRLRATIDTTASTGHAPSIMALQQVGESTCTLGEVRNRADVVVYWGSDPLTTHPRHIERYATPWPGRTIIVVDRQRTATAEAADLFLPLEPGQDQAVLTKLRLLVRGEPTEASPALIALAKTFREAKFGIIFFGTDLTQPPMGHRNVEALLRLVTELNNYTRFYARRMRRYGDVAGADSVLAWQTGYPFGVNFARGYPRYNPAEFTGPEMLERQEVDAALILGSETVSGFSEAALDHLRSIPTVLLDSPDRRANFAPTVKFTTAVYGIHRPGTVYRMDEVPIPLRVLLPSDYPSDAEVLESLS